jgi:ABC-2 type transport system permease protein
VIGALGNLAGAAVTGTALVCDASPLECLHFLIGSILSPMIGFMLGVLIRASIAAIVAYFIYQFC